MKARSILTLLLSFATTLIATARTYVPVTFTHEGLTVNGRLTLPSTAAPYRVIVVAPGSGANDRDATLPMYGSNVTCLYPGLYGDTLRPYKGLSDALSDSGYAVFTYDKLEYTYPTGMGTITYRKLWLPVASALNYLKTRTDIDTNNVVLLGHSEGSTLIPYIARPHPGVKALISLAGPRRSVYDTILSYQLLNIARTCNGDTATAKAQGDQLLSYFATIRSGNWNSATPPFAGVSAAVWSDYIKVADSVVINYNRLAKPTLFIGLGDDINVPVSTELNGFRNDITIPANFYEIAGLNHYLTTANNPATSKILTDTIIYWLRRNVPSLTVPSLQPQADNFITTYSLGQIDILAKNEKIQLVRVTDMAGRCVFSQRFGNVTQTSIPMNLSDGIYIVLVQGPNSSSVSRILR